MRKHLLAWWMVGLFGACGFPTFDPTGTTEVEKGNPCVTDANCDDDNPCTIDVCSAETLVCEYTLQASGPAPAAAQTPADCKTVMCDFGAQSTIDDPQDVINDNNSCTTDACTNGAPTNEINPDGSTCSQGVRTGTCTAGTCVITCMNNNDCDDQLPCTEDFCNTAASICTYTSLHGVPTPGVNDIVGDCKARTCENGQDIESIVEDDVLDDNKPCTTDICTMGVPSNPSVPARTPCVPGDVKVCDGQGECVECVVADDCVTITETECEKRSCVNNVCRIAYQGVDTLAAPSEQTDRDCKKVVCNGNTGTTVLLTSLPDDTDLPLDGNPCTKDICTNGTPSNPVEATNFVCGANPTQYCNATGQCVGCTAASQCAGTDSFCQIRTCTNGICGVMNTANGTDLPMADQTAGDCKVRECNGNGGIRTVNQNSDIPVDGNPCTQDICTNGTPSNPYSTINSPCSVGANDACDGAGTCKKSNGNTCGAAMECVTARCVDGVCCATACSTLCRACNVPGSEGTCVDVPKGQDDGTCTGNTQSCNAGQCDYELGQACTASAACSSDFCVDGVCCESACGTACKSCNVTGSVGTCSNLPSFTDDTNPANICSGANTCNGMGSCLKESGQPCAMDSECVSGNCAGNNLCQ